ncbi:MAG: hypothetical protein CMN30_09795 [Sandaracinus sp.]|mgnify:CR=1 FL=1|nr:hypothetical protein [Sandaracinus sp.]MAQ15072.1 hypothetical protein [Sandaracinus sp.]
MQISFTCPSCRAELVATPDGFECAEDGEAFPRVGPFLVLTPQADEVLSRFRDPFLAALAECGEVTPSALARIEAAHRHHRAEPETLREDITGAEDGIAERPGPAGPAANVLERLVDLARTEGPLAALEQRLPAELGRVVEIGPGAGGATGSLAGRAERLTLVDRVPRILLRARRVASRGGHPAPDLVVAFAEALPFASESVDTVVAMNVVDLLEDPASFLEAALDALATEGTLFLTTPDPGLGSGDAETLPGLIEALGGEVVEVVDGLPWIRRVGPRHTQLYLTQLVVARRA